MWKEFSLPLIVRPAVDQTKSPDQSLLRLSAAMSRVAMSHIFSVLCFSMSSLHGEIASGLGEYRCTEANLCVAVHLIIIYYCRSLG